MRESIVPHAMVIRGINTWDNQHCDLVLNKISPDEDEGVILKQMYVTMGDTWVITTEVEGGITLEQLTTDAAANRVRRQLNGPAWALDSRPDDLIIRLYRIAKRHLP